MHIIQPLLFDFEAFVACKGNDQLMAVLEAVDAEKLLAALGRERWTGRRGYPVRGMWAALVCGLLRQCHSLAQIIRLLQRDKDLRTLCGFPAKDEIPSEDALYRFVRKLERHRELVEECLEQLVERLRDLLPGFGQKLVADSTDIKAYSNRHGARKSDPDAAWGAKKAGYQDTEIEAGARAEGVADKRKKRDLYYWFGYKLHLLIDAVYELPVSVVVTPANKSDTEQLPVLLVLSCINTRDYDILLVCQE